MYTQRLNPGPSHCQVTALTTVPPNQLFEIADWCDK